MTVHLWHIWLAGIVAALVPPCAAAQQARIGVELVSDAFEQPLLVTAPEGDARLFVVDQPGRVWIVKDGARLDTPFLDITAQVGYRGERGLLGLAFHPDYARNGRFFLDYTNLADDTQIVGFTVSDDPDRARADSATRVLRISQPAGNHNGGWIEFGPDGYLYIGMGDGGGGGDAFGNGQNRDTLLATLLRIDVDAAEPYGIPASNPFVNGGGRPEIFAYGLRNPWRAAFDGDDIYIADVGQNAWEEISVIGLGDGGANLGWPVMEGAHCYRAPTCDPAGMVAPVHEFSHPSGGCSITGGYVYRGSAIPALDGHYFFSDYCAGFVRSFRYSEGAISDLTDWSGQIGKVGNVTSFGRDGAGELYITAADGRVFKIVPR